MNKHPYLRAYMAGIFVPSLFLLLVLTVFIMVRLVFQVPIPLERVLIFPMALVPNLFGAWNMLYVRLEGRVPIGFHGALLPVIMAPLGAVIAEHLGVLSFGAQGITWFQQVTTPYSMVVPAFCAEFFATVVVYYLVWKYIVGSLNRVLEIA